MKRCYLCLILVCVAAFLSGCIQNDTTVTVKPDGSGTIEETVLYSSLFATSLDAVKEDGDKKGSDGKEQGKASDSFIEKTIEEAKKKTGQFGPQVKLISIVPLKKEKLLGYKATYAFGDINVVTINQNPKDKTESGKTGQEKEKKEEPIQFKFVKGPPAVLTVTMPPEKPKKKEKPDEKAEKKENADDPKALEMMKMLFGDMRIGINIRIEGTIVKTNATHRDGSHVTLMEMDFGKIVSNAKYLKKLNEEKPETIEDMKKIVKGIEGLKIELNNPVVVEFK